MSAGMRAPALFLGALALLACSAFVFVHAANVPPATLQIVAIDGVAPNPTIAPADGTIVVNLSAQSTMTLQCGKGTGTFLNYFYQVATSGNGGNNFVTLQFTGWNTGSYSGTWTGKPDTSWTLIRCGDCPAGATDYSQSTCGTSPLYHTTVTNPPSFSSPFDVDGNIGPYTLTGLASLTAQTYGPVTGTNLATYQWEQSVDDVVTWTAISGATSATLTHTPTSAYIINPTTPVYKKFRCKAKETTGTLTATSGVFTAVTLDIPTGTVAQSPASAVTPAPVTFTVTASATTKVTYQWQMATSGSTPTSDSQFSAITGATGASYTTPATDWASMKDNYYRVRMLDTAVTPGYAGGANGASPTGATGTVGTKITMTQPVPTFSGQPQEAKVELTGMVASTATFSCTVANSNSGKPSFSWFYGTNSAAGGTTAITNNFLTSTLTINVDMTMNGRVYWCSATAESGGTAGNSDKTTGKLTITNKPTVTGVGANFDINQYTGTKLISPTYGVTTSPASAVYKWQRILGSKTAGTVPSDTDGGWADVTAAGSSASFTVSTANAGTAALTYTAAGDYWYRVAVTDTAVEANGVTKKVVYSTPVKSHIVVAAPSFGTQPSGATKTLIGLVSQTVTFDCQGTDFEKNSISWFYGTNTPAGGSTALVSTNNFQLTLTLTDTSANSRQYFCRVTNVDGSSTVDSNKVTLGVKNLPVITSWVSDFQVDQYAENAKTLNGISYASETATVAYQWQTCVSKTSTCASWSSAPGTNNGATYVVPALTWSSNGDNYYRVVVTDTATDANGLQKVNSPQVKASIKVAKPELSLQPSATTKTCVGLCGGDNAQTVTFDCKGTDFEKNTITWFYVDGQAAGGSTALVDTNNFQLTVSVTPDMTGRQYYCHVVNVDGSASTDSNKATLTVRDLPVVGALADREEFEEQVYAITGPSITATSSKACQWQFLPKNEGGATAPDQSDAAWVAAPGTNNDCASYSTRNLSWVNDHDSWYRIAVTDTAVEEDGTTLTVVYSTFYFKVKAIPPAVFDGPPGTPNPNQPQPDAVEVTGNSSFLATFGVAGHHVDTIRWFETTGEFTESTPSGRRLLTLVAPTPNILTDKELEDGPNCPDSMSEEFPYCGTKTINLKVWANLNMARKGYYAEVKNVAGDKSLTEVAELVVLNIPTIKVVDDQAITEGGQLQITAEVDVGTGGPYVYEWFKAIVADPDPDFLNNRAQWTGPLSNGASIQDIGVAVAPNTISGATGATLTIDNVNGDAAGIYALSCTTRPRPRVCPIIRR